MVNFLNLELTVKFMKRLVYLDETQNLSQNVFKSFMNTLVLSVKIYMNGNVKISFILLVGGNVDPAADLLTSYTELTNEPVSHSVKH